MNPLAQTLNETLERHAPEVFASLSAVGKRMFFPRGIIFQSAQAKQHAHRFNATIGIAVSEGQPMKLPASFDYFSGLEPAEIYPYAPTTGRPKLRTLWRDRMAEENPNSMAGVSTTLPVVTAGITHGLSVFADLFVNPHDTIVLPNLFWGNYNLLYSAKNQAQMQTFPLFTAGGGFDVEAMRTALQETPSEKAILILNFPNNPTGYTPTKAEGQRILEAIEEVAQQGKRVVVLCDDAYFGLNYESDAMAESLFGALAQLHERVIAVKLDGATKELFAWGFRVGFITIGSARMNAGSTDAQESVLHALEQKMAGIIRGNISNTCHHSQSILERILCSSEYKTQHKQCFLELQDRAVAAKALFSSDRAQEFFTLYPFNSGYFCCVRLRSDVEAETYRQHMLKQYGIGLISINSNDIRVATSSVDEHDLAELVQLMIKGMQDLGA